MTVIKRSALKEEYWESYNESCKPRRTNTPVEKHFENLLRKAPKVTDKPIVKIIGNQLDIKLGQFTAEELDLELGKIENRKTVEFDEIPSEVWKMRNFNDILVRYCCTVYYQNTIDRWTKSCILPFPKKSYLGIAKNYWSIILP